MDVQDTAPWKGRSVALKQCLCPFKAVLSFENPLQQIAIIKADFDAEQEHDKQKNRMKDLSKSATNMRKRHAKSHENAIF